LVRYLYPIPPILLFAIIALTVPMFNLTRLGDSYSALIR
jgi:hypothetical protein